MLPLKVQKETRGIVHLASHELGYFEEGHKDHLIAVARLMAIALENKECDVSGCGRISRGHIPEAAFRTGDVHVIGGLSPSPRKLSAVSARIIDGIDSEAEAIRWLMKLGSRCRPMIRDGGELRALLAEI